MQAPVDYPIADAARNEQFSVDELLYATLLDRVESGEPGDNALSDEAGTVGKPTLGLVPQKNVVNTPKRSTKKLASVALSLLARDSASRTNNRFSLWSRTAR